MIENVNASKLLEELEAAGEFIRNDRWERDGYKMSRQDGMNIELYSRLKEQDKKIHDLSADVRELTRLVGSMKGKK